MRRKKWFRPVLFVGIVLAAAWFFVFSKKSPSKSANAGSSASSGNSSAAVLPSSGGSTYPDTSSDDEYATTGSVQSTPVSTIEGLKAAMLVAPNYSYNSVFPSADPANKASIELEAKIKVDPLARIFTPRRDKIVLTPSQLAAAYAEYANAHDLDISKFVLDQYSSFTLGSQFKLFNKTNQDLAGYVNAYNANFPSTPKRFNASARSRLQDFGQSNYFTSSAFS